MTAGWAAVLVAGIGLAITIGTLIWHGGRLSAILDRLTDGQEDHENRLRDLEHVAQLLPRQPAARARAAARRPRPPTAG